MMNKWLWLLIFLIWLVIGYFLSNKFICAPAIPAVIDKCAGWDISDGSRFEYENGNSIHFRRNSFNHLTGYTGVNTGMTKIANYLKANGSRALNITGLYDSDETNSNPLMSNLGYSRADNVKRWLTGMGVPANQIGTNSKVSEINCYRNDTLRRGVTMAFTDLKKDDARLAAIKNGKPMMLYFATGADTPTITADNMTRFNDLFYYLDNVPGSKLNVDGHTDNVGNLQANMSLSQNRADDIRNYITQNGGVALNRMDTNGYGPNQPIAPNDTPANKALNRRVSVTLQ